jgi:hypothetical protein
MPKKNIASISKTLASLPPKRRELFAKRIENEAQRWRKFQQMEGMRKRLHITVSRLTDETGIDITFYQKYCEGIYLPALEAIGNLRQTLRLFGQYEVLEFAGQRVEIRPQTRIALSKVFEQFKAWVDQQGICAADIKQMTKMRFDYLLRQSYDGHIKRVRKDGEYFYPSVTVKEV